jgi:hypothetical protein
MLIAIYFYLLAKQIYLKPSIVWVSKLYGQKVIALNVDRFAGRTTEADRPKLYGYDLPHVLLPLCLVKKRNII